jgi:ribonuclease HII
MGRTWKNIKDIEKIRNYLLSIGGTEEEKRGDYEIFRIKIFNSHFIQYKNGTLYSTPSQNEKIFDIWKEIDKIVGGRFISPTKDFLMGLDETGKGEIIGPLILVGVLFKKDLFNEIDYIIGSSDTKKRHDFEYWDNIFRKLKGLTGFFYYSIEIPPRRIDKDNINHLLDEGYTKIIKFLLRDLDSKRVRVVIDDYGVGDVLRRFLDTLDCEIIIEKNSEDKYLETRTASIISKRLREEKIKKIREDGRYIIDGITIGSGNLDDKETLEWLRRWMQKEKKLPSFIRKSYIDISKFYYLSR